jgi:hypothetical protein
MNLVHSPPSCICKTHCNTPSASGSSYYFLSFRFSYQNPVRTLLPCVLYDLYLIILVIFGEEYKLWSYTLFSFLRPAIISFRLDKRLSEFNLLPISFSFGFLLSFLIILILPHFQRIIILRFCPAFWWQHNTYLLPSVLELPCFSLWYLCYVPIDVHQHRHKFIYLIQFQPTRSPLTSLIAYSKATEIIRSFFHLICNQEVPRSNLG